MASSNIALNYAIWMHVPRGAPTMAMAEYVAEARAEDEGTRHMFAIRSGTSDLHGDRGRRTRPITPRHRRTCAFCDEQRVEDVHHVVASCTAHAAARRVLVACLPAALSDLANPDVVDALMGAPSLRERVPDDVARNAATVAFKNFLVRAFRSRADAQQQ